MNKEQLVGLGLTDEQAKKVLELLDGNFVTKDRFNTVNAELKQAREDVKTRDEQLEGLKSATGAVDALKQEIADLQEANQQKDKEHAVEMKHVRHESLDERLLLEAKAINPIANKNPATGVTTSIQRVGLSM